MISIHQRMRWISLIALCVLGSGWTARADSQFETALQNTKNSCGPDIKKFCSDVNTGEGRVAQCLASKADQISPTCNTARKNLLDMVSQKLDAADVAMRKNCGSDMQKFCANVPTGGGRVWDCLDDHGSSLSGSCKNQMAKISNQMDKALS